MGIIDEEKVKQLHRNEWCKVNDKLFISATLAETELQNLAIEFAEWLNNTYYLDETGYYVVSGKYISTFELFEVYKTIKNKLI